MKQFYFLLKYKAEKVLAYPHVIHCFKDDYFTEEGKKAIDVSLHNQYC